LKDDVDSFVVVMGSEIWVRQNGIQSEMIPNRLTNTAAMPVGRQFRIRVDITAPDGEFWT